MPFTLSAPPGSVQRLAPSPDVHTDDVLPELGFGRGEVDALVIARAVARA